MNLDRVTPGAKAPDEINVIIEIPMHGDPIKYEVDKATGKKKLVRKVTRVPIDLMAALQRGDLRGTNEYQKGRLGTEYVVTCEGADLADEGRYYEAAMKFVQAAAAAVALHRVSGVGHKLQLAQDELRQQQRAFDKPGFADVRDPAVDDHAGVEDLAALSALALGGEDAAHGGQVQHVTLGCAHHQADIAHQQKKSDLNIRNGCFLKRCQA